MRTKRIFAYLIDSILIGILTAILVYGFTDLHPRELIKFDWGGVLRYDSAWYINLLISILYFLMDGMYGRTVGKHILKLRVVTPTSSINLFNAIIRSLMKVMSIYFIFGIIFFFFMKSNSSLHDRMANTSVELI